MKRALGFFSALAIGVLLMLGFRSVLHLGQQTKEAPTLGKALLTATDPESATGSVGSEFIYHAVLLDTVDQTGKLDLGIGWLYFVTINPIPKLLWPGKYYPESPGVTMDDITANTGIVIANGSAPGIVADLYRVFGLAAALFLYAFGRLSRRLYDAARLRGAPFAICAYVMLHALSLNIFAQGFGAMFAPMGYSLVPIIVFSFLYKRRIVYKRDCLNQTNALLHV
jgi:hypothetical protein